MTDSISFSILVPVFNGERYLRECLDSVLPQLSKNDEILVHDDGSTDKTKEILESYGTRICCSSGRNHGVSLARNEMARKAKGDYLLFLDSDDLIKPGGLNILRQHLQVKQTDCALTPILFFQDVLSQPRHVFYERADGLETDPLLFFVETSPPAAALIVSHAAFQKIGGFNPWMRHSEEFDLVVKLIAKGFSWSFVSEVVRCNRVHSGVRASHNQRLCLWRSIAVLHSLARGRYGIELSESQKQGIVRSFLSAGRLLFRLGYFHLSKVALSFADRMIKTYDVPPDSFLDRLGRVTGTYQAERIRSAMNVMLRKNSFGQDLRHG